MTITIDKKKTTNELIDLTTNAFLAVCDITYDILEKVQLISQTDDFKIPIIPSEIRFKKLCPRNEQNTGIRYFSFRNDALIYLFSKGLLNFTVIKEPIFSLNQGLFLVFILDRNAFLRFAKILDKVKQQNQRRNDVIEEVSQTIIEDGIGFLLLDNEKIEVGLAKNIPFKFLKALCPAGKMKNTEIVFNMSSKSLLKAGDSTVSLLQKKDKLRHRLKDLQKLLKKKVLATISFNTNDTKVCLKLVKKQKRK
jgi:hypothetical protein